MGCSDYRNEGMAGALIAKFPRVEGLMIYDGRLIAWPVDKLGTWPSDAQLQTWTEEWLALPEQQPGYDAKQVLLDEISACTTLAQIRTVVKKLVR